MNALSKSPLCAVVTFDPKYRDEFARLNYAWITKYFAIEAVDQRVLDHPEEQILAAGGQIFFAIDDRRIVGTVALKVEDASTFELTKMAVDEALHGRGYGRILLDAAVKYAHDRGAKRLVLSSHTSLIAAISLYRRSGFVERKHGSSCYSRCNIYMERLL